MEVFKMVTIREVTELCITEKDMARAKMMARQEYEDAVLQRQEQAVVKLLPNKSSADLLLVDVVKINMHTGKLDNMREVVAKKKSYANANQDLGVVRQLINNNSKTAYPIHYLHSGDADMLVFTYVLAKGKWFYIDWAGVYNSPSCAKTSLYIKQLN